MTPSRVHAFGAHDDKEDDDDTEFERASLDVNSDASALGMAFASSSLAFARATRASDGDAAERCASAYALKFAFKATRTTENTNERREEFARAFARAARTRGEVVRARERARKRARTRDESERVGDDLEDERECVDNARCGTRSIARECDRDASSKSTMRQGGASVATTTTTMGDDDRALLREEIEVRKLELGSRMAANALNLYSLMQTHTANALKAEGNKIAAESVAETKAERRERNERYDAETFQSITCDALALGLGTTCAMVSYFAWREVKKHAFGVTARCGSTSDLGFSPLSMLRTISFISCVASESARAVAGFVLIAIIAFTLTRADITRRFRAAPMFVSVLALGVGVGAAGARAVSVLGGDRARWLFAWRSYVALVACSSMSAKVFASGVVKRVEMRWLYYAALGVVAPTLAAFAPFARLHPPFALAFANSARTDDGYYYAE